MHFELSVGNDLEMSAIDGELRIKMEFALYDNHDSILKPSGSA